MSDIDMAKAVMVGAGTGVAYSIWGFKALADEGEEFDGKKFVRGILVGAGAGALGAYLGIPFDEATSKVYLFLASFGLNLVLDQLAANIWGHIKVWRH